MDDSNNYIDDNKKYLVHFSMEGRHSLSFALLFALISLPARRTEPDENEGAEPAFDEMSKKEEKPNEGVVEVKNTQDTFEDELLDSTIDKLMTLITDLFGVLKDLHEDVNMELKMTNLVALYICLKRFNSYKLNDQSIYIAEQLLIDAEKPLSKKEISKLFNDAQKVSAGYINYIDTLYGHEDFIVTLNKPDPKGSVKFNFNPDILKN